MYRTLLCLVFAVMLAGSCVAGEDIPRFKQDRFVISYCYSAWPTVEFDASVEDVREIDKRTGEEISPRDDSPRMPGLQISLEDGEGRLFLL